MGRAKKKARQEKRTPIFVDESGFYLLPALVKTYAPCGQTPILRVFETHDHLSVMSAITPQGKLFTLIREDSLTGEESLWFLNHLHRQLGRKLLVIWDGAKIHHNQAIRQFLSEGGSQFVYLERLPAYAPDLNPAEGVWGLLKRAEMRNLCCRNLAHLEHELRSAICRLRRKPQLIRSCFAGADLKL